MFLINTEEIYETQESKWVINSQPTIFAEKFRPDEQLKIREKNKDKLKKIIFLDRDGPCLYEPKTDGQIDSINRLEITQGLIINLHKILTEMDYLLVMVSNQNHIGHKTFARVNFFQPHNLFLEILAGQGIIFDEIFIDKSTIEDKQPTRKPGTKMLEEYLNQAGKIFDLANSWVIGDRETDMQLAQNLGSKGIRFYSELGKIAKFNSNSWEEIYNYLKKK